MQIKSSKTIKLDSSETDIHIIHVIIDNLPSCAKTMIDNISDESWIAKLSPANQIAYEARARRTIDKLVRDIFMKIDNEVTANFGEYMISMTAQSTLETEKAHKKLPLAELFKEKVTSNPGFDFHTESHTTLLAFGEAKYSSRSNPYKNALTQINCFITLKKDLAELADLQHFASSQSIVNASLGKKAYIAAFSLNNPSTMIFDKILESPHITPLLSFPELYLIGVEVIDQ